MTLEETGLRCPKCGYLLDRNIRQAYSMIDDSLRVVCGHCETHFGIEADYGITIYKKVIDANLEKAEK